MQNWAGRIFGTNVGNVFIELEGTEGALKGMVHFNNDDKQVIVFSVEGSFRDQKLILNGAPEEQLDNQSIGSLEITTKLNEKGTLEGNWRTSAGNAGTIILFPHQTARTAAEPDVQPDQLYAKRHNFGAVELYFDDLISLADEIQRDFKSGRVIITVVTDTEQSLFLEQFKEKYRKFGRASVLKVYVQEPESTNINRILSIEFGPQINNIMAQG